MRTLLGIGLLPGVVLAAGFAPGQTQDKKPAEATIAELIADLGHPVFSVREKAVKDLWKRGTEAVPALEKAARDPDPEVAQRARDLLDKIGWGLLPDTPPAVVKLLRQFQGGNPDERRAAVGELLKHGKPGRVMVRAILQKDLPVETRQMLVTHLTGQLRRDVPVLLFEKKADDAADLLALHAWGTTPEGVGDFAALHVLRDTLPAAIAEAEAALKTGRHTTAAKLTLAHLYRATRDWAKAREAVADFPRQPNGSTLVEMLLEEEGNWPALLENPPPGPTNLPEALTLTLLRRAGKATEFDGEAKRVRNTAEATGLREEVRDAAFALLLNNRADDATELLLAKKQNLDLLAEVLIGRMRYKEALDLLPARRANEDTVAVIEANDFNLRRARVLMITGNRDAAVQLFGQVATALRRNPDDPEWAQALPQSQRALLRTELRVGLRELACEHAAHFVSPPDNRPDADRGETPFEILFGTDAAAAELLYWALRERNIPSDKPGAVMNRVRELFAGTAPDGAADEAAEALAAAVPIGPLGGDNPLPKNAPGVDRSRAVNRHLATAAMYRAAKRFDEAEKWHTAAVTTARLYDADRDPLVEMPSGPRAWVFGTSDATRPWLEFGDFLFDRGRFAEAAETYFAGWKHDPDQPLLLFLSGKALAKAGNAAEGTRRKELAHWVPLGNERGRGKFLEELVRRGEATAAKRETDLLLRACWSRDFYFGNVMNQAARAAALGRDFATAELCVQRSLLVMQKVPLLHFVDPAAYLTVPHEMLASRARTRLAGGKPDEAMALARAYLAVTPGNVDFLSGFVQDLDKLGHKREADEVFALGWGAYQKVLAAYPDSPTARNALAALAANTRRELDKGLTYGKEAVAADPKSAGYRESLAEVHFRRGERDAALAIMTALADEFPRTRVYKRQLVRYKSGDVASPFPDTEDD